MKRKILGAVMLSAIAVVGARAYLKSMGATFIEADCKVTLIEVLDNLGEENRQAPEPSAVITKLSQFPNNSCDVVGYEVRKTAIPSELELRIGSKMHRWTYTPGKAK
jgi:hypothetical protein